MGTLKWTDIRSNCSVLYDILVHESGHSFGFGHVLTRDSIMYESYDDREQKCKPAAYDVAAMMANYQSPRGG